MANFKDIEQEQLVGYWIKRKGITKRDLDTHPCIDDVILLLQFKKEFSDLPSFWKAPYHRIYKSVYKGKIPLKQKQLNILTRMTEGMIVWRKKRDEKKAIQRQKIKAYKNPKQKSAYDMMAKDAGSDTSPPWGV